MTCYFYEPKYVLFLHWRSREESKIEAEKLFAEGKKDLAYKKFASSIDVTPQMAYEFIQVNFELIIVDLEYVKVLNFSTWIGNQRAE